MDKITITKTGVTLAATTVTANVGLPTTASGTSAKYVRVASLAACYVKLGTDNTVAAVAGDVLVQPADAVILRCAGLSYIAAITPTGSTTVQISPLEDQ